MDEEALEDNLMEIPDEMDDALHDADPDLDEGVQELDVHGLQDLGYDEYPELEYEPQSPKDEVKPTKRFRAQAESDTPGATSSTGQPLTAHFESTKTTGRWALAWASASHRWLDWRPGHCGYPVCVQAIRPGKTK